MGSTDQSSSDQNRPDASNPSTPASSATGARESQDNPYRQPASTPTLNCDCDQIVCLLDKIARTTCSTANEVHRNGAALKSIAASLQALVEMYRTVNPGAALDYDRQAKLRADLDKCCPPEEHDDEICKYVPCPPKGGVKRGDGWSAKSRGYVPLVQTQEQHPDWTFVEKPRHDEDEGRGGVPLGAFTGLIDPRQPTPRPMDFRGGPGPAPPGTQGPVGFRTFTETELAQNWPPDMSGARGGDVVLMSGNLWLKLSVDGGQTFTDLDFTKIFAQDTVYGGWAGDQVIHYIPAIDCFVLYVQSFKGKDSQANRNVVKIALASQSDLKTFSGGKQAWWRQWDFTPDTFGLGTSWMDFPDLTYGKDFLHVNTNVFVGKTGKLFYELPLADMVGGKGFSFLFAFIDAKILVGSPAQNVTGNEFYFAQHVDNSHMRIYSSVGGDANYAWREREVLSWPRLDDGNVVAKAPDNPDWISEDHRIIGATRRGNELWFAWTAASGDGGHGGFSFPFAHVQVVRFDIGADYKRIDQFAVWNPDHAYCYPSLATNSDGEVGISLAWGGGTTLFGSHAVGILGDWVVWYGDASDVTVLRKQIGDDGKVVKDAKGNPVIAPTRFGDYLHVRLAQPDPRWFGAFGYAVKKDASVPAPEAGKFVYYYVEFGREVPLPSPIK
jgi:hypothetical protein